MDYKIDTTPGSLSINENGVLKSPDIQTENGVLLLEGLTWERSTNWKRDFIEFAVKYYHKESTHSPVRTIFMRNLHLKIKSLLASFIITAVIGSIAVLMITYINN